MKKVILIFLISLPIFAQKAVYNKVKEKGEFTEYETKSGNLIKIGDTINIGYPLGNEFTFLTNSGLQAPADLSNNKAVIFKIKSKGKTERGFKIYVFFKPYGALGATISIDYESALETGEIKNPFK